MYIIDCDDCVDVFCFIYVYICMYIIIIIDLVDVGKFWMYCIDKIKKIKIISLVWNFN